MSTLNSTSTLAEIEASYADNASYAEGGQKGDKYIYSLYVLIPF